MTEKERKARIEELLSELRELQAVPRSDWHAAFEALLKIEMHRFGDRVHIRTEEEIGVIPPRTDFVILVEDEKIAFDKAIFRIFRKINILEYKNPRDSLNERVIRKACGYANLYIAAAEHEGDRPEDQVTVSVFRANRNEAFFSRMKKKGMLVADAVPGIYYLKGIVDLPFQIIITSELKGDEYAAYRALTVHADQNDVKQIINRIVLEKDEKILEYYDILVDLISVKNPDLFSYMKEERTMFDTLMEIMKDDIDEKIKAAVEEKDRELEQKDQVIEQKDQTIERKDQEFVSSIRNLMSSFSISADSVMDAMKIPEGERSALRGLVMRESNSLE